MRYITLLYLLSFFLAFGAQTIILKASESNQTEYDMQDLEKIIVSETKNLYSELQNQVQDLQAKFLDTLSNKIDTISSDSYSLKKSMDIINFFNDELIGFRQQIKVLSTQTISDYFAFLEKNDSNFSYDSDLTASQATFIDGVDNIEQESLVIVQQVILDLTSQNVSKMVSLNIKHGFFESERHAQMLYEEQLKANEQAANRDWWDHFKAFGRSYIKELAPIAKEAIGKEVAKETQKFITEVGNEVASEIGKKVSQLSREHIAPAISGQLAGLSEKLEGLSPVVKDKLKELSGNLKEKGIAFWESENAYNDVALGLLRKVVRWKNKVTVSKEVLVYSGSWLCRQEQKYLKNRTEIVQEVLKKHFGIEKPLRIAFCCSGGGNRAMIGTLGIFMAAAKHNVLQATTYIAGLSGSTWTIAPWVYLYSKKLLKKTTYQDSLQELKNNFIAMLNSDTMIDALDNNIFTPPMLQGDSQKVFANQIVERFSFEQPISLVNAWGALVGNYALNLAGPSKLDVVWSAINSLVVKGTLPLPLCSAVFDARLDLSKLSGKDIGSEYEWFETGPFEAGSKAIGYVPIKYFGSPFNQGKIISELACPEYPMNFYLGLYGSAFSLAINDLIEKGLKNPKIDVMGQPVTVPVSEWLKSMIEGSGATKISSKRHETIHAQFANFSKGMSNSYLKDQDLIGLFDGGVAFNFPLPLLLDRKDRAVDIIIIYGSNPRAIQDLKTLDKYFKRKNISVPIMGDLNEDRLLKEKYPMAVFNDPRDTSYNEKQPTYIYFPTNVDVKKPPFITANFKYTKQDIDTLMSMVSDSFENHINDIKTIMKKVADMRPVDRFKVIKEVAPSKSFIGTSNVNVAKSIGSGPSYIYSKLGKGSKIPKQTTQPASKSFIGTSNKSLAGSIGSGYSHIYGKLGQVPSIPPQDTVTTSQSQPVDNKTTPRSESVDNKISSRSQTVDNKTSSQSSDNTTASSLSTKKGTSKWLSGSSSTLPSSISGLSEKGRINLGDNSDNSSKHISPLQGILGSKNIVGSI